MTDRKDQEGAGSAADAAATSDAVPEEKSAVDEGAPQEGPAAEAASGVPEVEPEPHEAAAPRRRRGGRLAWIVLTVVLAFVAGVVVFAVLWPAVAPLMPAGIVARLEPDTGPMAARLDAAENRLNALERRADQSASTDEVAALAARVAALEDARSRTLDRLEAEITEVRGAVDDNRAAIAEIPAGPGADVADRLAAVEQRLDDMADRSGGFAAETPDAEARGAVLRNLASRISDLADRVGRLEDDLAAARAARADRGSRLEQTVAALNEANSELAGRLDNLAARLADTEVALRSAGGEARRTGLVLAVTELYQATRGFAGYAEALAAVTALGASGPEIEVLARHAEAGVPTLERLRARFPDAAAAVVRAAVLPADEGWLGRAANRLGELVSIRRVGEREGDNAEAVVARAEVRLEAGQLGAALAELEALSGAAAPAIAEWRADAAARHAVDQAVEGLRRRVVTQLAPATD